MITVSAFCGRVEFPVWVFNLVVALVAFLAEYPAGRPGWTSPCFLAIALCSVAMLSRWPIPESICGEDCEVCR